MQTKYEAARLAWGVDDDQSVEDEWTTDYESLSVAELRDLLKEADKPVSGKKSELIARLKGE